MAKVLISLIVSLSLAGPAFAAGSPVTEEEKVLYAVGLSVAKSLSVFDLSRKELEMVQQAVVDAVTGQKIAVDLQAYNPRIQELARTRRQALGAKQAMAGKEFIDRAAKEKGAMKTASGMVYLPLTEGGGASAASNDTVTVNYRGTLVDGREFDSSYKRGKPIDFRLDSVIKCWTEGVQRMKVGGKAKLACPPELAYGSSGVGDMIMPGATLAFEVELLDVKRATTPPAQSAKRPAGKGAGAAPIGKKTDSAKPHQPAVEGAP